jgi:DNA-binding beta-propeller fold protein YncE
MFMRSSILRVIPCLSLLFGLNAVSLSAQNFQLVRLGTFAHGSFDQAGAEIGAYDPATKRAFVTNGARKSVDVLNVSNPASPSFLFLINLSPRAANSVAFRDGVLAIAVEAANKTDPGSVEFYDAFGTHLKSVPVGSQPDMITFTPDGRRLLTANEGEPNDAFTVDPEGSVSIIDISSGIANATVATAGFLSAPLDPGVRRFGPNAASVTKDFEPEYIAISPDSTTAWVTIQEANAIGILNIAAGAFTRIANLGLKDHSLSGNGLDASDMNGGVINIANWPIKGMYQPDTISLFRYQGKNYLVTANEGDTRDWPGFSEVVRLGSAGYVLDSTVFPNAATLKNNNNLGRLNVTRSSGDTDGDGDFDVILSFGGRSFSIWSADVAQTFDSGDQFEQYLAAHTPATFNVSNTNNTKKNRSDDKGPESEGLTVYGVAGRTFATIGLERDGGLFTYELLGPSSANLIDYITNRDFTQTPALDKGGDLGPEGVLFIKGSDSPNGKPLLMVTNEVSATTTLYQIRAVNDITEKLQITVTGGAADRGHDTYTGRVKFWNRSDETIDGNFYFIPTNVEGGLDLKNKTGTWQGRPYIELLLPQLAPGEKAEFDVEFSPANRNIGPGQIQFEAHILAGSL